MKKYHDISSLKFEDCFLVITIDGEPKKFALKKISSAQRKNRSRKGIILKSLLLAMEYIGLYWMKIFL